METKKSPLLDLVLAYLSAKRKLAEYKTLPDLVKPIVGVSSTIADYTLYNESLRDYYYQGRIREANIEAVQTSFNELTEKILATLPASHIWFLTEKYGFPVTQYAIAIQRSDWPMDPPTILIKTNPTENELPQLKLQHIAA